MSAYPPPGPGIPLHMTAPSSSRSVPSRARLASDGLALVDRGHAPEVRRALDHLGADDDAALRLVRGACLAVAGASDEAIACLEPLMDGRAAVAWRLGMVHYLLGDPDAALATYRRADADDDDPSERARLAAWSAAAHWARGDAERSNLDAQRALDLARDSDDPGALAAAHIAVSLHAALIGDRRANWTHQGRALDYAQRAGDVLQEARIRANWASKLTEEGRHEEALREATAGRDLARSAGFTICVALSAVNRGLSLVRLGRLDEAVEAFTESCDAYQAIGSKRVADALGGLADVHRERGDLVLARVAYEEALDALEGSADCQARVPVLVGLARVCWRDDPARAEALVADALACPGSLDHPYALATAGWLRLAAGDRASAAAMAERAVGAAGRARHRALSDALQLAAMAADDPATRRAHLHEAAGTSADVVDRARIRLALARADDDAGFRRRVAAARSELARLGAGGTPALGVLAFGSDPERSTVEITCLGRFEVRRHGEPVPTSAWQSRKARDLLKLLAARRGRSVAREQVMDALWPGVPPAELGNRLAVVVATVRRVLDPARTAPLDHYVSGEDGALALDVGHVELDVVTFLDDVVDARRAVATGDQAAAETLLAAAVAAYRGDAFEEDPYAEWAWPVREEARAAYAEALHRLLGLQREAGAHDDALATARLVLSLDAYDEAAHRACVELLTGERRHGEAERARVAYAARMDELGVVVG